MFSELTEQTFNFFSSCCEEELRPIFVVAPSKKKLGISLSARILKTFWLQDLTNRPNSFKNGDIIEFSIPPNTIGKKKSTNLVIKIRSRGIINKTQGSTKRIEYKIVPETSDAASHFNLEFDSADDNKIHEFIIQREWIEKYGNKTRKGVSLTKSKLFIDKFNEFKNSELEKYPLAKFLGVDSPVTKSQLRSKVYYITGRGHVEESRNYLQSKGLEDIVKEGLVVKESLKDFAYVLANNQDRKKKLITFRNFFNGLFGLEFEPEETSIKKNLQLIHLQLSAPIVGMEKLVNQLDNLKDILVKNNYSDKALSLENIINNFLPDLNETTFDISLVKCIILDEPELAIEYSNAINELIAKKIPVIILSDYANYKNSSRETFQNLTQNILNKRYQLNWKTNKIIAVKDRKPTDNCLDYETYNLCKRYLEQKICINAYVDKSNIIDKFFYSFEILGALRQLEGFEGVKSAYSNHLRPVIYWLKNSPTEVEVTNEVRSAIESFSLIYNQIRNQLSSNSKKITHLLDEILNLLENNTSIINSKELNISSDDIVYFNQIFYRLGEKYLPLPKLKGNTILFTGTPFEEGKYYFLRKELFENFSDTYFFGFCNEAENIYNRFIIATNQFNNQINDLLPRTYIPFWNNNDPSDKNIIYLHEKCDSLENDVKLTNLTNDFDELQQKIELDKYQNHDKLSNSNDDSGRATNFPVNIIELEGNKLVFLKKNGASKILVLNRNNRFEKADWEEIKPGDRVFTYIFTRKDTLEMRGDLIVDNSVFEDLDNWYDKLQNLLMKFSGNYTALSHMLNALKNENKLTQANPEISNLRNWSHKSRFINAPESENLKLILLAASSSKIDEEYKKIMIAKRIVEKNDRRNRESIRNEIDQYIRRNRLSNFGEFFVNINTVSILIKHGIVKHKMSPENLNIELDKIGIITNI